MRNVDDGESWEGWVKAAISALRDSKIYVNINDVFEKYLGEVSTSGSDSKSFWGLETVKEHCRMDRHVHSIISSLCLCSPFVTLFDVAIRIEESLSLESYRAANLGPLSAHPAIIRFFGKVSFSWDSQSCASLLRTRHAEADRTMINPASRNLPAMDVWTDCGVWTSSDVERLLLCYLRNGAQDVSEEGFREYMNPILRQHGMQGLVLVNDISAYISTYRRAHDPEKNILDHDKSFLESWQNRWQPVISTCQPENVIRLMCQESVERDLSEEMIDGGGTERNLLIKRRMKRKVESFLNCQRLEGASLRAAIILLKQPSGPNILRERAEVSVQTSIPEPPTPHTVKQKRPRRSDGVEETDERSQKKKKTKHKKSKHKERSHVDGHSRDDPISNAQPPGSASAIRKLRSVVNGHVSSLLAGSPSLSDVLRFWSDAYTASLHVPANVPDVLPSEVLVALEASLETLKVGASIRTCVHKNLSRSSRSPGSLDSDMPLQVQGNNPADPLINGHAGPKGVTGTCEEETLGEDRVVGRVLRRLCDSRNTFPKGCDAWSVCAFDGMLERYVVNKLALFDADTCLSLARSLMSHCARHAGRQLPSALLRWHVLFEDTVGTFSEAFAKHSSSGLRCFVSGGGLRLVPAIVSPEAFQNAVRRLDARVAASESLAHVWSSASLSSTAVSQILAPSGAPTEGEASSDEGGSLRLLRALGAEGLTSMLGVASLSSTELQAGDPTSHSPLSKALERAARFVVETISLVEEPYARRLSGPVFLQIFGLARRRSVSTEEFLRAAPQEDRILLTTDDLRPLISAGETVEEICSILAAVQSAYVDEVCVPDIAEMARLRLLSLVETSPHPIIAEAARNTPEPNPYGSVSKLSVTCPAPPAPCGSTSATEAATLERRMGGSKEEEEEEEEKILRRTEVRRRKAVDDEEESEEEVVIPANDTQMATIRSPHVRKVTTPDTKHDLPTQPTVRRTSGIPGMKIEKHQMMVIHDNEQTVRRQDNQGRARLGNSGWRRAFDSK
eukprot:Rmarinus@m.28265